MGAQAMPEGNIRRDMYCKNLHTYGACNIASGLQIQNTFHEENQFYRVGKQTHSSGVKIFRTRVLRYLNWPLCSFIANRNLLLHS
jgi:hypothetical protein